MKYAITGPAGAVHQVSDTIPTGDVTFAEITDEQAAQVAAARTATPPYLLFLVEGALITLQAKQAAIQAARQAEQAARQAAASAAAAARRAEFEATREAQLAVGKTPAAYALDRAERLGIDVPFGNASVRMACGDRDRALFSSALVLYRTYEDELPSDEAKAAFRASPVTFADASGNPYVITVTQARQLIVAYGSIYAALWTAAASANNQS